MKQRSSLTVAQLIAATGLFFSTPALSQASAPAMPAPAATGKLALQDCNVNGTNCSVVRTFANPKMCQRQRVAYMMVNKNRKFSCTTQDNQGQGAVAAAALPTT